MAEDGWIVPLQGYSGSVQWVAAEDGADVLYIHDYTRGLEVVRLSEEPATGTWSTDRSAVSLTSNFTPPARMHAGDLTPLAMVLLGVGIALAERRRARIRRARSTC